MPVDLAELGRRLREARVNCAKNQDEVAKSLQLPRAAIVQIESGLEAAQTRSKVAGEKVGAIKGLLGINKKSVDDLIHGIYSAAEASGGSLKQIKELELVSRRIDKIVDAITTVSIQTNMLAVNGSIEAARAGEFGKGFMVVSTDIRNLARESAENADRIKDVVKATQDQIVAVRRDLEQIAAAAAVEVQNNKAITTNLAMVEQDMAIVLNGNEEILKGSDIILTAVQEAQKATQQIAIAADQASKGAIEAASAAKQQSKGAEELAVAVEEIASLADELQNSRD